MSEEKGISMIMFFLSAIVVGLFVAFIYHQFFSKTAALEENNFVKTGNLVKDNPGMEAGAWYLVYDMPGSPAVNKKLSFNEKSICFESCSELIQGERVIIKGIDRDGVVLVRSLDVFEEGLISENSPSVIEWDVAIDYLKNCEVKKASQNHDREIRLTLTDGREMYSVEPKIDNVLDKIEEYESVCGNVPLATE